KLAVPAVLVDPSSPAARATMKAPKAAQPSVPTHANPLATSLPNVPMISGTAPSAASPSPPLALTVNPADSMASLAALPAPPSEKAASAPRRRSAARIASQPLPAASDSASSASPSSSNP